MVNGQWKNILNHLLLIEGRTLPRLGLLLKKGLEF
jgi:hypothetical protein